MLINTVLRTSILVAVPGIVEAAWTPDRDNEKVGTLTQTAVRQAAPVVSPIPATVDGKMVFSNATGVDIGGPPWRNSPLQSSQAAQPVPAGSDVGTVIRGSTGIAVSSVTIPPPSVSLVISPPNISTFVVSLALKFSSSSSIAPPLLHSSKSTSSVVVLPTTHTSAPPTTVTLPILSSTTIPATIKSSLLAIASTSAIVRPSSAASQIVNSTILVFARDSASANSAYSGLNAIGAPYQLVLVPKTGITLPVLNISLTAGNYGGIVVLSEACYDYETSLGFQSLLSAAQWAYLYQYQADFGVRMVRMDAFPGPAFGTRAVGDCCNTSLEQLISISDISYLNASFQYLRFQSGPVFRMRAPRTARRPGPVLTLSPLA